MDESTDPRRDEDRRRSVRHDAQIRVVLEWRDEPVATWTDDLSHGGLYMATPALLPIGTPVVLSLDFPDAGPPARVDARVAYVLDARTAAKKGRQMGMGMEFIQPISDEVDARIGAVVTVAAQRRERRPNAPWTVLLTGRIDAGARRWIASLTAGGHRVLVSPNGLDALASALRGHPDVVVAASAEMPGIDAFQLVRLLRTKRVTRDTPMVLLGAPAEERDRLRGYEAGIDAYLDPSPAASPAADRAAHEQTASEETRLEPALRAVIERSASGLNERGRMRGSLKQVSVRALLRWVRHERHTGTLTLRHQGQEGRLSFRRGEAVALQVCVARERGGDAGPDAHLDAGPDAGRHDGPDHDGPDAGRHDGPDAGRHDESCTGPEAFLRAAGGFRDGYFELFEEEVTPSALWMPSLAVALEALQSLPDE